MNLLNFLEPVFNSSVFYEYFSKCLCLIFFGFTIRQALILCGQRWANTYHHLATYVLLPNIALMVTTVIKNDIALSLGMIGALSIVRFRNPVKSPFELVMFFGLMTIGIVSSVQLYLSTFLYLIILSVITGIKFLDFLTKKIGVNLFQYSFGEGNLLFTLEVKSSIEIKNLHKEKNVISYFFDKENKNFFYRFSFSSKAELISFEEKIKNTKGVINIRAVLQT